MAPPAFKSDRERDYPGMIQWPLLALGCAAATTALAPVVLTTLHRHGAMDVPNHRSSHAEPTVRGGGVACLLGIFASALCAELLGVAVPWLGLAAAMGMALLGLVTDLWDLPPTPRLFLQVLAGATLGGALGGPWTALLGAVAFPILINAVNFMDGINGITGLTVTVWAAVILAAGASPSVKVLAALAGAAALAFLPWNLPNARMFLGDCGSYLFGALAAVALVTERLDGEAIPWSVLAPLGPYLLDTGYTLARRALRGEDLTQPHREHLYQRLVRRPGWTHGRVALLYALLALLCGAAAHLILRV